MFNSRYDLMNKLFYRPEIDGLRSIAVISVILYHAELIFNGENWFEGGFIMENFKKFSIIKRAQMKYNMILLQFSDLENQSREL